MKTTRLLVLLVTACRGPSVSSEALDSFGEARLENADDVKAWTDASAPGTAMWWGPAWRNGDPSSSSSDCPRQKKTGDVIELSGDCTDHRGSVWRGKATRKLDPREQAFENAGSWTFEGFGYERIAACPNGSGTVTERYVYDGTLVVSGIKGSYDPLDFTADLVGDVSEADYTRCTSTESRIAIDYALSQAEGRTYPEQRWRGRGRVGSSRFGTLTASTDDEVLNMDKCSDEALAGSTTLRSGARTVVISYDGETNCTDPGSVRWSLDGTDMGTLSRVYR